MKSKKYIYIVDLDERGYYNAHVEEEKSGKVIYSISNENTYENEEGEEVTEFGAVWLVEDGFMKHIEDMDGLTEYLIDMKVIGKESTIKFVG